MKLILMTILCVSFFLNAPAQRTNPAFDSTLAASYGADDYGMKMYTLVILQTGSTVIEDKDSVNLLFAGHLSNINRLVEIKKLIVAGPLGKNDLTYRGIFILNVSKNAEAMELLDTDPAIKAGLLSPILIPWYGSAALPEYLPASDKVWKIGF